MGFDNECIQNIQSLPGEYFCPVCRMLVYPNEAIQSQCTHLYCKPCLDYIVATTTACPYDGYLVTLEHSKPLIESNKVLAETIGKVDVYCLYVRSGCTWRGSLLDCRMHCETCAFGDSPVVCNRCAVQIVHRTVQEHAQTCPGVPSQGQTAQGAQTSTNQMQAAMHQAAQPVTDVAQQQYQQFNGSDPNQQYYQQQLVQHPHLQSNPPMQSLPPPPPLQTHLQQQQALSVVQMQQPAQQYPQSQAISVSHQQNHAQHMIHPQSHIQPHIHLQAQPQVHPHAYPPQANYMNHYPANTHKHVDHFYHLQSQSGMVQQPSGSPYPQEGHHQQHQHTLKVQNQVPQPQLNPTELHAISSFTQHQIIPTAQQQNLSHQGHLRTLQHRPTAYASGQPNEVFSRNEIPHRSHIQLGKTTEQLQTYPVTTEGVPFSTAGKQPGAQSGTQSEPNKMSAENIAAKGCLESKETSLVKNEATEGFPALSASGNKVISNENSFREKRVNDSEEHNSVGRFGSVLSNLKEGDPDIITSNSQNIQPANEPDSSHTFGLPDGRMGASQDKLLLEQDSVRLHREDLVQFPRHLNVESERLRAQGRFFSPMPHDKDSLGVRMIPMPLDKTLYGLHHDKHLKHGAFPEDIRLDLSRDLQSVTSMYSHNLRVAQAIAEREQPNMSSHAIRFGSHADFQLKPNGRDQSLLAHAKPLNLLPDDLAFMGSTSSHLLPHLPQGSFSGQTRNAQFVGHGIIPPPGEVGYRSNLVLSENRFHKGDLELLDNIRMRKAATMGWCRICRVDCDTVEGLDLHSQTWEHQRMSIDMVLKIKQQNSMRHNMTSGVSDLLLRNQSSQDYRI